MMILLSLLIFAAVFSSTSGFDLMFRRRLGVVDTSSRAAAQQWVPKQCPLGYELHYDQRFRKYGCQCKKYHLYWPQDGNCYREYQQGPCQEGHRYTRIHS